MLAEVFLQGEVQEVRGRMGAADALAALDVDRRGGRGAEFDPPFAQVPAVEREAAVDLAVDHLEVEAGADDLAVVAHLSAHLAVEGGFIEYDDDRMFVVDFVDLLAQLVVGDDADHAGVGRLRACRSRGSGCRAWLS